MNEIKLKPCPFCGSNVLIENFEPRLYRPSRNHLYCGNCDLLFGYNEDYGGKFDTKEEAANAWNRRTDNG